MANKNSLIGNLIDLAPRNHEPVKKRLKKLEQKEKEEKEEQEDKKKEDYTDIRKGYLQVLYPGFDEQSEYSYTLLNDFPKDLNRK